MRKPAGSTARPAFTVEYPSTSCRYCWPMNIAPISEPKTMMPATAATQKVGRAATFRSYSGFLARRCRMTNSTVATADDDEQPHRERSGSWRRAGS